MRSDTRYIYDVLQRNNFQNFCMQNGQERHEWQEMMNRVRNLEDMMTINLKNQGQQEHRKCGRERNDAWN